MFSMEERVEMLREATKHIPNVRVTCFSGLLNEFCKKENAPFIVRGLRAFTDFEYEFQRALLLKKIDNQLETVFIMTNAKYSFVSSCSRIGNIWWSIEGFGAGMHRRKSPQACLRKV